MSGWIKAAAAGAFVAVFAIACATTGHPPAPPPLGSSLPACAASTVIPDDVQVCVGSFTPEGLACVVCDVPTPCLLSSVGVYCTATCGDPYCGQEP
jgi:hypothetical protein